MEEINEERVIPLLLQADDITGPDHFMCRDGTEVIITFKDTATAQDFTDLLKTIYTDAGLELAWLRQRREMAEVYYRTAKEIFGADEAVAIDYKNTVLGWGKEIVDWGYHDEPFYVVGEWMGRSVEELNADKVNWERYLDDIRKVPKPEVTKE